MIMKMACGLPGAGKTTYRKKLNPSVVVVSSDDIREECYGSAEEQSHNGEVFNIMLSRTAEALCNGQDVYFDATNLVAKNRTAIIKELKARTKTHDVSFELIFFAVPLELAKERNQSRTRHVPEEAIEKMWRKFDPPHKAEGWDRIIIVSDEPHELDKPELILSKLMNVSHDNVHHSKSIGEHMISAYNHLGKGDDKDFVLTTAVKYHDIGKAYTKAFYDAKGNPSNQAHYYGHESVGAYLYLTSCPEGELDEENMTIASLIKHHMDFFKSERYVQKVRAIFGEAFYTKLVKVHNCDLAGH